MGANRGETREVFIVDNDAFGDFVVVRVVSSDSCGCGDGSGGSGIVHGFFDCDCSLLPLFVCLEEQLCCDRMLFACEKLDFLITAGAKQDNTQKHCENLAGRTGKMTEQKQQPRHYEKCSFLLYGHTASVHSLTDVGGTVCSGSADHTIRTWDTRRTVCDRVLMKHEALVSCLASWHDHRSHLLLSGAQDDRLCIWDLKQPSASASGCAYEIARAHNGMIHAVDIVDENRFVSTSSDMTVKQWDIRQLKQCVQESHSFDHMSGSSIFSSFMMQGSSFGGAPQRQQSNGNGNKNSNQSSGKNEYVSSFVTSFGEPFAISIGTNDCGSAHNDSDSTGPAVFVGSRNGVLLAANVSTGQITTHYHGHYSDITACCVSSAHCDTRDLPSNNNRGCLLLSGSKDHTIRLFDAQSGDCLHSFDSLHSADITCLQFFKELDGRLSFYGGSRDGTIKETDVASKSVSRIFERLTLSVYALHRNVHDGMLYCGSDERVVRAWHVSGDL